MTREAKLYTLEEKEWQPLVAMIGNERYISIYQLNSETSKVLYFAVLSLNDKTDKIVEEYGAIEAIGPNSLRAELRIRNPLYGDRTNVNYLTENL